MLQEPPLLDQGGSVAELSRPIREGERKFKAKRKKPQGRKETHQSKNAIYHNWFSPFLFKQIDNARIFAGGPKWSTRAIVSDLKKRDGVVFAKLNRTTVDLWIDRTGEKPKWSDKTLERIQKGNHLENPNAGRKGVLVRCFHISASTVADQ